MCLEEKKNADLVEIKLPQDKIFDSKRNYCIKRHMLIQKTEQKIPASKPYWDILILKTYFLTGHKKLPKEVGWILH